MSQPWNITLVNQERRRRVALVEGEAAPADPPAGPPVAFSLTFYSDQVSLNLPASTEGRAFIRRLIDILGPPRLEPTIKCSCEWSDGVMGAMLIVLWDLPPQLAPQRLRDLGAFLGMEPLGL